MVSEAIMAVAKAGVGAFSGSDNPVSAAICQATRSTVAVVSSSNLEEAKMVACKLESPICPIGLQTPWDLERWEMASGFVEPIEPLPRVVFHAAPSIEEAQDALSELTTVIEKDYLSPNAPGLAGSWVSSHKPDLAFVETKTCVGNAASITPAAPKHAIQAVRLLHESADARKCVASIVSDQNVWNAVMQNKEVVKYLACATEMKQSVTIEELADDDKSCNPQSPMSSEKSCDSKESGLGKRFMHYVWNIKERITTSVAHMTGVAYPEMKQSVTVEELADDDKSCNRQSPKSSEKSCDSKESGPGKWFMGYVWDIKERVTMSVARRTGFAYPEVKQSVTVEELAGDDKNRNPPSPMSSEKSCDSNESGPGNWFMGYVWNIKERITTSVSHRTGVAYPEMKQSVTVEELADDDKSRNPQSPMPSEKSCDSKESGPGKWFMSYVWDIKERITTSVARRTGVAYPEVKQSVTVEELADDDESRNPESPMPSERSCDSKESGPGKRFMEDIMDRITIQNLFGGAVKGDSSAHSYGIPEATIATSILPVVVMVIMVVVLKRV